MRNYKSNKSNPINSINYINKYARVPRGVRRLSFVGSLFPVHRTLGPYDDRLPVLATLPLLGLVRQSWPTADMNRKDPAVEFRIVNAHGLRAIAAASVVCCRLSAILDRLPAGHIKYATHVHVCIWCVSVFC